MCVYHNVNNSYNRIFSRSFRKYRVIYEEGKNLIVKINNKKYLYPPKAGVIIFNRDFTKVLVVKNIYNPNNPKYGYPKGHKEDGETDEYCASREAREETGLKLDINKKDPFIKINNSIYFVYSLFNDNIKFNPIDKKEIDEAKFMYIEELKKNKYVNKELEISLKKELNYLKSIAKEIIINRKYNVN
jgi:NADH pyrophosphatase NudC (nudix superfamily)